jgi:phosphoglycolate phosphatase
MQEHPLETMMYKIVLFDLDGTLADSVPGIVWTINASLAEFGIPAQPEAEIVAMIGLPLDAMFARFAPADRAEAIPELVLTYRRIYASGPLSATPLFPGIAELLRQLHATGIKLTIASSKIRPVSSRLLNERGVLDLFALVMGNDTVAAPKPAPEMVLATLAQLGFAPAEALMVGDSIYDLEMGRAAGVHTCAVTWGVGLRAELEAAGATYVIDSVEELGAIVRGL